MAERQKANAPHGAMETYAFAQSIIQANLSKAGNQIEHWVVPVVDSSRYFALRIQDPNTGREAFIGIGFRERLDATNFRMSMEDYVGSLKREMKAKEMHDQYEQQVERKASAEGDGTTSEHQGPSQFSLKEGEKIHVAIKNKSTRKRQSNSCSGTGFVGLRPPPPPSSIQTAGDNEAVNEDTPAAIETPEDDEWGDFEG